MISRLAGILHAGIPQVIKIKMLIMVAWELSTRELPLQSLPHKHICVVEKSIIAQKTSS